jgi:hypothetical protein
MTRRLPQTPARLTAAARQRRVCLLPGDGSQGRGQGPPAGTAQPPLTRPQARGTRQGLSDPEPTAESSSNTTNGKSLTAATSARNP